MHLVHDLLFLNLYYFHMIRTVKENPSDGTFESKGKTVVFHYCI